MKNMEWAGTAACRSCRWPDRTASSWCWSTPAATSCMCPCNSCIWSRAIPARRPRVRHCTSWAPTNGRERANAPPTRSVTWPPNYSTCMRNARPRKVRRWSARSWTTRPSPTVFPSRKPLTRPKPSARCCRIFHRETHGPRGGVTWFRQDRGGHARGLHCGAIRQTCGGLVPTTLLAEQHTNNFRDRFADWPVRVETLSRFRTGKKTMP